MKILVINCGSSSIKYKLYEMEDRSVLAAGGIEKVGLEGSFLKTKINGETKIIESHCPTHTEGIKLMLTRCFILSTEPYTVWTKYRQPDIVLWQVAVLRKARLLLRPCLKSGASIWNWLRCTVLHI